MRKRERHIFLNKSAIYMSMRVSALRPPRGPRSEGDRRSPERAANGQLCLRPKAECVIRSKPKAEP